MCCWVARVLEIGNKYGKQLQFGYGKAEPSAVACNIGYEIAVHWTAIVGIRPDVLRHHIGKRPPMIRKHPNRATDLRSTGSRHPARLER